MQQIIKELESDNPRLFKEKVIRREATYNVEFFEGCKMALDKLYTFGVKQVITTKDGLVGAGNSLMNLLEN